MHGTLFRYAAGLQAFESPPHHSFNRFCICIGGLTDGLLPCPYVEALGDHCQLHQWALVQPVLSSSYAGFGLSSLSKDVQQIGALIEHLVSERGAEHFALVGHSTGCQDAVHFLARAPPELRRRVRAAVLQAPVSDRESNADDTPSGPQWLGHGLTSREQYDSLLAQAEALVASARSEQLLPTKYYGFVPISASRFVALNARGGEDDYFSSDFSDAELSSRLAHLSTAGQRAGLGGALSPVPDHPGLRVLFALSDVDEYVPRSIDVRALGERFVAAAAAGGGDATLELLDGANHNLSEPKSAAARFVHVAVAHITRALESAG